MKNRLKRVLENRMENFDKQFDKTYHEIEETFNRISLEKEVEKELIFKVLQAGSVDITKLASELAHSRVLDVPENFIEGEGGSHTYSEQAQSQYDEWYAHYYELLNK
jgi:hypothetical protein